MSGLASAGTGAPSRNGARRYVPVDQILRVARDRRSNEVERLAASNDADESIAYLMSQIAIYRSAKNALRRVCFLPDDICLEIFRQATVTLGPPRRSVSAESRSVKKELGWVVVTHVCRHWRECALEMPALWTSISLSSGASWVKTFLERSRKLPLLVDHVSVTHVAKSTTRATTGSLLEVLLREQSARLKAMTLAVDPTVSTNLARLLPAASLPVLEELHLVKESGAPTGLKLPTFDNLPRLRALGLSGFLTFPSHLMQSSLTALYLDCRKEHKPRRTYQGARGVRVEFELRTEWPKFESVLRGCPSLRELTLLNAVPYGLPLDPGSWRPRPLEMPSLRMLSMRDHPGSCAMFLKLLHAPSLSKLNLETWELMIFADLRELLPVFSRHISPPIAISLTQFNCDQISGVVILEGISKGESLSQHFQVRLEAEARIWASAQGADYAADLLSRLAFDRVRDLNFDIGTLPIPTTKWLDMFRDTPQINSIVIKSSNSAKTFCKALELSIASASKLATVRRKADMLFPAIRQLTFHDVDFNAQDENERSVAQNFEHAMTARAPFGGIPRCLTMHNCAFPDDFVDRLKTLVPVSHREWTFK